VTATGSSASTQRAASTRAAPAGSLGGNDPSCLEATDLSVQFTSRRRGRRIRVQAVDRVSFEIGRGETLALVGESGSGKSTVARAVNRLVPLQSGTVVLEGDDITHLHGKALRWERRRMQMVFQDPYSSLDPSSSVRNIVAEPLRVHEHLRGRALDARVGDLLSDVGLSGSYLERYPHEFSGGQRQRIAIARAIATKPALVVLDEAVSALDVSTQNQILVLLQRLRDEHHLSYLFISHNLSVVRWLADRTAVMYRGRLVEIGPAARVADAPAHPYTRSLLSALPVPDPLVQRSRTRIVLVGDPPDMTKDVVGCPFAPRCPEAVGVCHVEAPAAVSVAGGGWATCHLLPAVASSTPVPRDS
jgi:peptide/nickel transport system ATP-binding protein